MATTISNASLTVTVSEQIILNGQPINSENQLVIPNINEVSKRIVTIPITAEASIALFGSVVAAGTFIAANVKYIRITNKDDTNFCRIRVTRNLFPSSAEGTFDIRLDAGKTFIMGNTKESASTTTSPFSSFVDMSSIIGQADTANVDLEVFIASI